MADIENLLKELVALTKDVGELRDTVKVMEQKLNIASEKITVLQNNNQRIVHIVDDLSKELHNYFVVESLDIKISEAPLRRYVPIRFYSPNYENDTIRKAYNNLVDLLRKFNFEISDDYEPIQSSWLKKILVRSKDFVTKEEVQDRISKLERSLELQNLNKKQAEVDKTQAEAVSLLLSSLRETEEASIQIGSILLVRECGKDNKMQTVIKTLTPIEVMYLEKNQNLLKTPSKLLSDLASIKDEEYIPLSSDSPQLSGGNISLPYKKDGDE